MYDIQGKCSASFFVMSPEIVPSPEIITLLINMFSDKGLIPSTFQEIGYQGPGPSVRLRLASPNNEWGINFASQRIDIEYNHILKNGSALQTIENFTNIAEDLLTRIIRHFRKRGNRLSIITTGLLRAMSNEQLLEVFERIFRPLPFYQQSVPFEWNSRYASKYNVQINDSTEQLNVITSINRIRGQMFKPDIVTTFDRIEVSFDINTNAENIDYRFTEECLSPFFDRALGVRALLNDQIRGVTNA